MAQGKISAKQQEILEYIKSQILKRGFPPSVRDICEAVHLKSTSSVHSHLETLEKNGYIRRDPTKPRAIEILDDSFNFNRREMVNVPIIDMAATGKRIAALRDAAGLTVRDLQDILGFANPQAIYKWQHGTALPTLDNLVILANAFDVAMDDIIVVEDKATVHVGA